MTPGGLSERPTATDLARARAVIHDAGRDISAAFALLTRLPVRPADTTASDASGAIAFPLVGALVGVIGAVPLVVIGWLQPLASLLGLAAIAIVTGALHLDGLADTADALIAPNPVRAEQARKDPAIGPGGAVTLLLVVAVEASALAAVASTAGTWPAAGALVVEAVAGRTVAVAATVLERSRFAPGGFGAWFAARVRPVVAAVATILALAIAATVAVLVGSAPIAVGGVVGAAIGLGLARLVAVWRGQLDGDALGAVVELTVASVLVAIAVVVTVPLH